jgi:D-alanyl-lipoteichoic acid acyltransferase DltB (MBOAT superfamily)
VSFISPLFFLCLAPAGIVFYLIPGRFRAIYLLFLSYAFYALSSRVYLFLLIVASAMTYLLGIGIAKSAAERTKLALMALGVAAIVAVIVAFKAAGAWSGFLLPLGLSYYSFKLISYLIEVYWDDGAVERDPVVFFLFPAFFPQIVSGPIQRPETFFRQMREIMNRPASDGQIETGFALILGGLMLKLLIADRLAAFIDVIDRSHGDFSYSVMVATVACYTLQLYADFAGYTNIALGIGKIFGIEGPPNFNAPFAATNIQEMWRRWHMSLTTWVTDYLFTPLSMSLRGLGQFGLTICITLNMVIIGLWHGLTLNFLVFGLLHAVFVTVTVFVNRRLQDGAAARARSDATPDPIRTLMGPMSNFAGMALTFALMSFSQIFWRSPTWGHSVSVLKQVLALTPCGSLGLSHLGLDMVVPVSICAAIALFVGAGAPGARWVSAQLDRLAPRWIQYGACLFALTTLATESGGRFVYGQF